MSGSAGEVGAAFVVDDLASAALGRIGAAFEEVSTALNQATTGAAKFAEIKFGGVTRSLSALTERLDQTVASATRLSELRFGNTSRSIRNLADSMATLGSAAEALPATFESSMNRVIGETERAAVAMRTLRNEMLQVDAAGMGGGRGIVPVGRGGGGGGGGGRGGGHGGSYGHVGLSERGIHAGGGIGSQLMSLPMIATGLLATHAIKTAAEYDLAVRNTIMNLGVADPDSAEGRALRPVIEEGLRKATSGTIYSQKDVAQSGANFAGIFASAIPPEVIGQMPSPMEKAKAMAGVEGKIFRFAETEAQMGKGSIEENMKAGVFLSHLTRQYTPEGLSGSLDRMLAISRMTGASPAEIERIMKYSVTTGGLAGVSPDEIMTLTGFLMQSGITGSTAGTGLAQVVQSLLKGETITPKQGRHVNQALQERHEFQQAIHGTVGTGRQPGESHAKFNQRTEAWTKLGILDPKTHQLLPEFEGPGGSVKLTSILEQLSKRADSMGKQDFAKLETAAIDVRGARATEPFLGKEQLALFMQYKTQEEEFTRNVGVLATQTGQAGSAMQQMQQVWARFNDLLIAAVGPMDSFGKNMKSLADTIEGWATWMRAHQPVADVLTHAADAAKTPRSFGGLTGRGPSLLWVDPKIPPLFGKPGSGSPLTLPDLSTPYRPPAGMVPYDPHGPQPGIQRESFQTPGGGGVHVSIQNVHFSPGTAEDHADQFVAALTRRLQGAQMHDLGTGGGRGQSSFNTGRGLSV